MYLEHPQRQRKVIHITQFYDVEYHKKLTAKTLHLTLVIEDTFSVFQLSSYVTDLLFV